MKGNWEGEKPSEMKIDPAPAPAPAGSLGSAWLPSRCPSIFTPHTLDTLLRCL